MISIFSFKIINVTGSAKSEGREVNITEHILESGTFLCISASVAEVAAVDSNDIKTLLANGLSAFFIKGKPIFSNGSRRLPRNPPDCTILESWVFDNFILTDKLFAKALRSLETSLSQ